MMITTPLPASLGRAVGVGALVLPVLLATVQGLDCYSCQSSPGPDCLSSVQVTCSKGQVCSNLVYRRSYNLGVLYTKGCQSEQSCLQLQNLNDAFTYCDSAPSQCTHCCATHLCNGAPSPDTVLRLRQLGTAPPSLTLCLVFWYLIARLIVRGTS